MEHLGGQERLIQAQVGFVEMQDGFIHDLLRGGKLKVADGILHKIQLIAAHSCAQLPPPVSISTLPLQARLQSVCGCGAVPAMAAMCIMTDGMVNGTCRDFTHILPKQQGRHDVMQIEQLLS